MDLVDQLGTQIPALLLQTQHGVFVVAPDGLWIETSLSVGRNWAVMEELDPKTGWGKKAA